MNIQCYPTITIQLMGYFIDFCEKQVQDPLSVLLSISKEDMLDERVEGCVEEMLEDYVW